LSGGRSAEGNPPETELAGVQPALLSFVYVPTRFLNCPLQHLRRIHYCAGPYLCNLTAWRAQEHISDGKSTSWWGNAV